MERARIERQRRRADRQIDLWVRGISRHDILTGTCCPDYSCCLPEFQATRREREHFAALRRAMQVEQFLNR